MNARLFRNGSRRRLLEDGGLHFSRYFAVADRVGRLRDDQRLAARHDDRLTLVDARRTLLVAFLLLATALERRVVKGQFELNGSVSRHPRPRIDIELDHVRRLARWKDLS